LTNTKFKCLKKTSPDELLKIFEDQLRILNKKISCESCNKTFSDTVILKHLSSKGLCKEYYKADEKNRKKWDLLKEDVHERRNSKRRLNYAIDNLNQNPQDQTDTKISVIKINHDVPDVIEGLTNKSQQNCLVKKSNNVLPTPSVQKCFYVKDEGEEDFTPLHLESIDIIGLKEAIGAAYDKYPSININSLRLIKNGNGERIKVDDRMVTHFQDEFYYLMEARPMAMPTDGSSPLDRINITLSEKVCSTKPTETPVSRQEDEVFANSSTRPNHTMSTSAVPKPLDKPEDGSNNLMDSGNQHQYQQLESELFEIMIESLPDPSAIQDLPIPDHDPPFRHRLSVVLFLVLINFLIGNKMPVDITSSQQALKYTIRNNPTPSPKDMKNMNYELATATKTLFLIGKDTVYQLLSTWQSLELGIRDNRKEI